MIDVFDEVFELPDPDKSRQFKELVGLDEVKDRLIKEGRLLLNPKLLDEWSTKHHGKVLSAVAKFHERPPLIVFSGDVGTGKTTLADSFGDPIARSEEISVRVFRLSLLTRGKGAVGEMTQLITRAFEEVLQLAREGKASGSRPTSAVILVIDEADALAQSRDLDQMHHEDRAGVNALIRGIDRLTTAELPVIIVLCTNRNEAIDPAVLRRAAAHFTFERPNAEQREYVLSAGLDGVFNGDEIRRLAEITGPNKTRNYGYTYSDLTQRLIPTVMLEAFPDRAITFDLAVSVAEKIKPTKPFNASGPN
ncbi:ATP-binding protein [Nitrospinae bacterium AH_259_B05_G02_I21]|nr:ATP-binding protein [Nitrospinae bacterium AH_259_B05_G02_I21]